MSAELDLLAGQGTVTAAAGCGKTHQIVMAAKRHRRSRPLLLLTHTNAGVAALRQRLSREGVPRESYRVGTLDGWAMSLISKFPERSGHHPALMEVRNPRHDYAEISTRAAALLMLGPFHSLIQSSYDRLIVDEYQDCSLEQHEYVKQLSGLLPTVVLGDPLQAIFGFGDRRLVDWKTDVERHFGVMGELTTPHRWNNVGAHELGAWLFSIRDPLLNGKSVSLDGRPDSVLWQELDGDDDDDGRLAAANQPPPNEGGTVLIIGDTFATNHSSYARAIPGGNVVESVDLKALVQFAVEYDIAHDPIRHLLQALKTLMSLDGDVGQIAHAALQVAAGKREPASDIESLGARLLVSRSFQDAAAFIACCGKHAGPRIHRRTIYEALLKTFRIATSGVPLDVAARRVREEERLRGRTIPARAVGSTLLLKGLETDVAVVMNPNQLSRQNLYVAITRGSRRLVVCSPQLVIKDEGVP